MKYLLLIAILALNVSCGRDDGEAAMAGETTIKGEKGDPGEDGKDGVDGKDGEDGVDAQEGLLEENMWVDPITGYTWLIGGEAPFAALTTYCSGEYQAPTKAVLLEAAVHGLLAISDASYGVDMGWTNETDLSQPNYGWTVLMSAGGFYVPVLKTQHRGIFCFKEAE